MSDAMNHHDWSHSALLIIDMQNDFCHSGGASAHNGADVSRHQAIVPALQRAIDAAHATGIPVIFAKTTHDDTTNSASWVTRHPQGEPLCVTGTWGVDYFGVAPQAGDIEIVKHRYSAFVGTDLQLRLRALSVDSLILAGVNTGVCVESTMRDGFMLDFYTVALADATSCRTHKSHEASLEAMAGGFGWVSGTDEMTRLLGSVSVNQRVPGN